MSLKPDLYWIFASFLFVATISRLLLSISEVEARTNVGPSPPNQFYLNEFCDLHSKGPIDKLKEKQDQQTALYLNNKNQYSSMRVQPVKVGSSERPTRRPTANGLSFEFDPLKSQSRIIRQLNCFFVVIAPKKHGLLLNVNSIGLPKNLTKLTITLNHETNHSQEIHLEGEEKPAAQYLLTDDGNSKIAIHLQSFKPIDWSHVSFDIMFTVYRKANQSGCPNKRWFDCGDNICVPASLVCDSTPNCPNGNDEMAFYKCYSDLFESIPFTIILVLLLLITIAAVVYCKNGSNRHKTRVIQFSDDRSVTTSRLELNSLENPITPNYLKSNIYSLWTTNTPGTKHTKMQPKQDQSLYPVRTGSNLVDNLNLGLDSGVTSSSGVHR